MTAPRLLASAFCVGLMYKVREVNDIHGMSSLNLLLCLFQMAMSPVFQKMFEANMRESKTRSVSITDFAAAAVEAFVHYLYHADVSLDENSAELWALADKYQVDSLKAHIGEKLPHFVNEDNVLELLVSGDNRKAKEVKNYCVKYLAQVMKRIGKKKSSQLRSLPKHILVEVMMSMAENEK